MVAAHLGEEARTDAAPPPLGRSGRLWQTRRLRTARRAAGVRWAPMLSDALMRLEGTLEELEREDAVRARWIHARPGS